MMQPYTYRPTGMLSSFVDVIWVARADEFCYCNITLPMLHHELIIDFSDRFDIVSGSNHLNRGYTAWLSGLQTKPIRTITGGSHFTAGILFKPVGYMH